MWRPGREVAWRRAISISSSIFGGASLKVSFTSRTPVMDRRAGCVMSPLRVWKFGKGEAFSSRRCGFNPVDREFCWVLAFCFVLTFSSAGNLSGVACGGKSLAGLIPLRCAYSLVLRLMALLGFCLLGCALA